MAHSLAGAAALTEGAGRSRRWLERIFAKTFDGLVYPQIWEDPRVDMEALELSPGARIIAIQSGGCNVLSYLAARPARIATVDLSPAHLALLRLKLHAAQTLDHERFFALFGRAEGRGNRETLRSLLPGLDEETRRYWLSRDLLGRPRTRWFEIGLYRQGMLGRCIGAAHLLCRMHGADPGAVLGARSLAEQRSIFERELAPLFDRPLVRALLGMPASFFGLGIPPAQFAAMRDVAKHGMADLVRERVERLACDFPVADNYFAWQAFGRAYPLDRRSVPPYLAPENFAAVKSAAEVVEPARIDLIERLKGERAESFDAFVLLDAQDWMDRAKLTRLWTEITRTSTAGARVIFRTAGPSSPLPAALPDTLQRWWEYRADRSLSLHRADRSAIYGGFHLYERREHA